VLSEAQKHGNTEEYKKNENGGKYFNPIPIGKWETYLKEV
jgi:hypothetical protein